MNLYARVTSERASKGQGGNKFLNIDVNILDPKNPAFRIEIKDLENGKIEYSMYALRFGKKRQISTCLYFYNVPRQEDDHANNDCPVLTGGAECDKRDCENRRALEELNREEKGEKQKGEPMPHCDAHASYIWECDDCERRANGI